VSRILIIQHEQPTPPGHVAAWFIERGFATETWRIDLDARPRPHGHYAAVVSLGSEFGAWDDSVPFVSVELAWLTRALELELPVLGICFGGQLLARALGGRVFRAERAEIGWLEVRTRVPELVPSGPWFQWHFDTFTVPDGAALLAESDVGPQAFRAGRSLGLQFHPEVTMAIMDDWIATYPHELAAEGVDPGELLAETKRQVERSERDAEVILTGFVREIAGIAPEEHAR
jgi:GMP synthase-like glutamine amidotransferase